VEQQLFHPLLYLFNDHKALLNAQNYGFTMGDIVMLNQMLNESKIKKQKNKKIMCSKNKSIIAILCAITIILGGASVSASVPIGADTTAKSVTSTPTVSNSTTSNSTLILEQLQQIINMLRQQIQQLTVLVQQKIQVLQQTNAGEALNPLPNQQGAAQSCDQVCKAQGYTSGICRDYTSNITSSIGCQSGETPIKNSSCSTSAGFVDDNRVCCCVGTPSTTAKINAVLILIANYPVQWAVLIKLGINLKIELIAWDCLLTQPAFAITAFVRKNHYQ